MWFAVLAENFNASWHQNGWWLGRWVNNSCVTDESTASSGAKKIDDNKINKKIHDTTMAIHGFSSENQGFKPGLHSFAKMKTTDLDLL